MADDFARRGYLTVIPDLFDGDAISVEAFNSQKVSLAEWLPKHQPSTLDQVSKVIIQYMRNTLNVKYLAGVGYCFGAKVRSKILLQSF